MAGWQLIVHDQSGVPLTTDHKRKQESLAVLERERKRERDKKE